jgi:heat shock protein HslJ
MKQKTLVLLATLAACCSCMPASNTASQAVLSTPVPADPATMTYRSSWLESGQVTLAQGIYRAPAAPGAAAELVVRLSDRQAFGTLGGKDAGAVVLVTEAGGTGTFYDLALLSPEPNGWVNSDVVLLGDRVVIHELAIRDNQLVVTMTTHGPQEPLCCPTLQVERRFAVQGGQLVAVGESVVAPAPAGLVGPVWQWVQTLYNNDTKTIPPHPENFTVQFGADGTVKARADCNRKGGRYSANGQQIAIEITSSTRAACPDGSLEEQFVRDLMGSAIWFLKEGDLYIDLQYDTGTMRLKP